MFFQRAWLPSPAHAIHEPPAKWETRPIQGHEIFRAINERKYLITGRHTRTRQNNNIRIAVKQKYEVRIIDKLKSRRWKKARDFQRQ